MNTEKFSTLMYALTKIAARDSFMEFLENWDITEEEYNSIRDYLKEKYGVKTYV
ncbi:hypothetical protein [Paenibacillus ihbetae]|uniref:hypothetical protein n=1 Tax=Paenibacillus ihbetae TaxID=1870820 RepID=UPI001300034D|nr:hypothetical protein [Paenibacillus ihbetae]